MKIFEIESQRACTYIMSDNILSGTHRCEKWYKFSANFFLKLLAVVLGPVSVEELVSVEAALSARFAYYWRKVKILTCLWF